LSNRLCLRSVAAFGQSQDTGTLRPQRFSLGIVERACPYNEIGNLTSKGGVTYTYPSPGSARPHAVTGTSNGGSFSYDYNPTPLRYGDYAGT
jgi:hypothetical protein